MPAQRKRPSAAQRRQAQRQREDRPSSAPVPAPSIAGKASGARRTPAAQGRATTGRAGHSRSAQFFATLGKSRWPTIIVAALVVAALVASGVVLYTQPSGGNATPVATALVAEPSTLVVLTPLPSPTP